MGMYIKYINNAVLDNIFNHLCRQLKLFIRGCLLTHPANGGLVNQLIKYNMLTIFAGNQTCGLLLWSGRGYPFYGAASDKNNFSNAYLFNKSKLGCAG